MVQFSNDVLTACTLNSISQNEFGFAAGILSVNIRSVANILSNNFIVAQNCNDLVTVKATGGISIL
jgi:hypothetical protein